MNLQFIVCSFARIMDKYLIRNHVKDNCKLYVFVCFFIVVVVNIQNLFFIRLCNLCLLRNTLKKILKASTMAHNIYIRCTSIVPLFSSILDKTCHYYYYHLATIPFLYINAGLIIVQTKRTQCLLMLAQVTSCYSPQTLNGLVLGIHLLTFVWALNNSFKYEGL